MSNVSYSKLRVSYLPPWGEVVFQYIFYLQRPGGYAKL